MKFDALLLDFGGVISRTLFECHAEIEGYFGLRRGSLRWRGPLDPASDELGRALSEGKISDRDYWPDRAAALGELVGRAPEMGDLVGAAVGGDPTLAVSPEAVSTGRKPKAAGH